MSKNGVKLLVGIVTVGAFAWAQTQTTYKVVSGDTLSEIAYKLFPKDDIYGSQGKLNYLIQLNPDIKDPNVIFPEQNIYLKNTPVTETEPAEPAIKEAPEMVAPSSPWAKRFYLGYGARYSSHTQDGLLGGAKIGDLSYKTLRAGFVLQKDQKTIGGRIESYGFSSDTGDQQNLNYNLDLGWKNYLVSLGQEKQPLFKVPVTGATTLHDQDLTYLGVGGVYQVPLANEKFKLGLKGLVKYAFDQSFDVTQVTAGSVSGLGGEVLADVEYLLAQKENKTWHLNWQTDANYWNVTNAASTATVNSDVNTEMLSISTLVGVSLRF